MNIRQAKNEIKHTVEAYLKKDEAGDYEIPEIRQRPVLLMGPPGIGKTQIMEQIARELGVGLVAYTITHHTRQSAVGLPFIREEEFAGKTYSVTEYTMSEIIASVYRRIRDSGQREVLVQTEEAAGAALEHAFDFMEQAFENGEEMVVFVTELTITSESARFLSEHTCERYLTYNKQLLIGTRRAELLSELRRDN